MTDRRSRTWRDDRAWQAGFIVGRADLIARIRRDPLARAMRPDRVTMAGVALTLGIYRAGRATTEIPVWRMIATPLYALRDRAAALVPRIGDAASVVEVRSTVGGGSLPGERAGLRRLAGRRDDIRFIVLSGHDEPLVVQDAMQAGAWAYVLKQSPRGELLDALQDVVEGRRYLSPGLMAALVNAPPPVPL